VSFTRKESSLRSKKFSLKLYSSKKKNQWEIY
jgi:hypothetical protein